MLKKVISGGQTGADIGGLLAAKMFDLKTGGSLPLGCKTHAGPKLEYLTLFDMIEDRDPGYKSRTWSNVYNSDGTLRIAVDFKSPGEKCTLNAIKQYNKPSQDITIINTNKPIIYAGHVEVVKDWILNEQIRILNIAGNSSRTWPKMTSYTVNFLCAVFTMLGLNRHSLEPQYMNVYRGSL